MHRNPSFHPDQRLPPNRCHRREEEQRALFDAVLILTSDNRTSFVAACKVVGLPPSSFHYYQKKFLNEGVLDEIRSARAQAIIDQTTATDSPNDLAPEIGHNDTEPSSDDSTQNESGAAEGDEPYEDSVEDFDEFEDDTGQDPPTPSSRNVFEAIRDHNTDRGFEPRSRKDEEYNPTENMPGTRGKLAAMAERAKKGLPLWHSKDRTEMDGAEANK